MKQSKSTSDAAPSQPWPGQALIRQRSHDAQHLRPPPSPNSVAAARVAFYSFAKHRAAVAQAEEDERQDAESGGWAQGSCSAFAVPGCRSTTDAWKESLNDGARRIVVEAKSSGEGAECRTRGEGAEDKRSRDEGREGEGKEAQGSRNPDGDHHDDVMFVDSDCDR